MLQCITTNFKFFEATNFVNLKQQLIKPGEYSKKVLVVGKQVKSHGHASILITILHEQ